jgi:hypothetical protein
VYITFRDFCFVFSFKKYPIDKITMMGNPVGSSNSNTAVVASGKFKTVEGKTIEIRDVWASNLEAEMEVIRDLLDKFNYVAMVSRLSILLTIHITHIV